MKSGSWHRARRQRKKRVGAARAVLARGVQRCGAVATLEECLRQTHTEAKPRERGVIRLSTTRVDQWEPLVRILDEVEFWTRFQFRKRRNDRPHTAAWHGMTRAAPTPTAPHETTLCMRRHRPRHLSLWGPALVLSTHGSAVAWTRHMRGRAARTDSSGLQAPFPPAVANFPQR